MGYGCTTCIGNSGPLEPPIADAVESGDLVVCSVLSGNRNFEGRISPHVKANYLASPPLVVAYAIAGSMTRDLGNGAARHPAATARWSTCGTSGRRRRRYATPSQSAITPAMFRDPLRRRLHRRRRLALDCKRPPGRPTPGTRAAHTSSTRPISRAWRRSRRRPTDIAGARILCLLGDTITTDHISPAGAIGTETPGGAYLLERQIARRDFNSYGARRGNHDVMMRGTFANIRIRNELAPGTEGGVTRHMPAGTEMPVYDAAMAYQAEGVPLVVIAGKEYGTGSSRDWAAKGTRLLGVRAVIAESFERIHRSNLVGMGVLPLEFTEGATRKSLELDGSEQIDLEGIAGGITPRMTVTCRIRRADGSVEEIPLRCRIDTADEADYYRHGGILHYVLRGLAKAA